jgi:hypothetical protein
MMTSQEACRHLRQLKKKMQKMVTTWKVHCCFLQLKLNNQG